MATRVVESIKTPLLTRRQHIQKMAFKIVVLCSMLALANAGYEITSGEQNIHRSYGNLGQISTYSKTIDTPFSSVSKHDVRVSNPGIAVHAAPLAYSQGPVYAQAPVAYSHGAAYAPGPVAYGHGPVAAPLAYAAPVASYGSPLGYAAPVAKYAAPLSYAAPVHSYGGPIAKVAGGPALLGVAYSAAPAVSHMTYTNGIGLAYSW